MRCQVGERQSSGIGGGVDARGGVLPQMPEEPPGLVEEIPPVPDQIQVVVVAVVEARVVELEDLGVRQ